MNLQDIGNGYGYIYCTAVDGTTIKFTEGNDKYGVQNIKNRAVGSSPVVASRSATGTITITACAAVGAITDITVCGISILGAPIPCTTIVPAEFATLIGQTINSFVSTPDFTAQAIGDTIYLFSPLTSPEMYNGCNIVVDVNTGTITATTTLMTSGVTNNEAYDLTLGARYMLNADYNSSYVTNTLAAVPTALGNYIEITKQIISRGTNVGGTVTNVEILNDTIAITNRVSSSDSYIVDTQGAAATDYLVAINPDGFMQGDMVFLRGNNPAHVVTTVSIPLAGLVSPVVQPNILLTGDIDFVSGSDSYGIQLMFIYSTTYKQYIFTEVGRTTSGFALNVGTGLETYVTGTSPFEFRTTKLLAASNLLADYGYKAAQTGTELQWSNNQLTGNVINVDGVFGVDGTALVFHQEMKYQTIGGAFLAIKAYRLSFPLATCCIVCAPGIYTETVAFDEAGVTIRIMESGNVNTYNPNPGSAIINNGAMDVMANISIIGDVYIYSDGRDVDWQYCDLKVNEINIANAINLSVDSCSVFSQKFTTLLTQDVILKNSYINCTNAFSINAQTITTATGNAISAAAVGIDAGAYPSITWNTTGSTIYCNAFTVAKGLLSNLTVNCGGIAALGTLTATNMNVYCNKCTFAEFNGQDSSIIAANITAGKITGYVDISAVNIDVVDTALFMACTGSVYASNKVKIYETTPGSNTVFYDNPDIDRSFHYYAKETIYDMPTVETVNNIRLITPADGDIHVSFDTIFTQVSTGSLRFIVTDIVLPHSFSFSGKHKIVMQALPYLQLDNCDNGTITPIINTSGACTSPVISVNGGGGDLSPIIYDDTASGTSIEIINTGAPYWSMANSKIVKTNAGFSIGGVTAVTSDIAFLGNANSNKAYAVADATYGTINSLTAPDYDLVVNANIV